MDTRPKVTINGRAEIPPGIICSLSEKAFIVPKSALLDLLKTESSELVTARKSSDATDKNHAGCTLIIFILKTLTNLTSFYFKS